MDAQDKITKQMQEAARNAESQSFPGMERVWEKVTERLDKESESKSVPFFSYKKIAAAAAVLIAIGLGTTYFLNEDKHEVKVATNKSSEHVTMPEIIPQNTWADTEKVVAAIEPIQHHQDNSIVEQHPVIDNNNINTVENSGTPENASEPVVSYQSSTQAVPPLVVPLEIVKIKGQVVDEHGDALPGAEIKLKGSTAGTVTDLDGNYEFDVAATNPQLEISYMGYDTKDISIAGNYDIGTTKLAPDTNKITDVVMTTPKGSPVLDKGYSNTDVATVEKLTNTPIQDVTKVIEGSVPGVQNSGGNNGILSISPNIVSNNTVNFTTSDIHPYNGNQYTLSQNYSMNVSGTNQPYSNYKRQQSNTVNAPVSDVRKAIEGAAPGVQVTNGSGEPGAAASIRIRGKSSVNGTTAPLIILNGVPYKGDIASIKPQDVASINILKDTMATRLYGARGSNGVIVITTKNGAKQAEMKTDKTKKFSIWDLFKK